MAIERLLESAIGRIIFNNYFDLVDEKLFTKPRLRLVGRGICEAINSLPNDYTREDLVAALWGELAPHVEKLHVKCSEKPPLNIHIAAVKPFSEIEHHLKILQKIHPRDRSITYTLSPKASDDAKQNAADIINKYAPRSSLLIGGAYNIFWATTRDQLIQIEREIMATLDNDKDAANRIRDRLGLVHIKPGKRGEACHLYAFESVVSLAEIAKQEDFQVARPTVVEGFDNPRFFQRRNAAGPVGFGNAIDMHEGQFKPGAPEIVSTLLKIGDNFMCRWLGKVTAGPEGNDKDFVDFLEMGRNEHDMLNVLQGLR